jgi:hypothetical protein
MYLTHYIRYYMIKNPTGPRQPAPLCYLCYFARIRLYTGATMSRVALFALLAAAPILCTLYAVFTLHTSSYELPAAVCTRCFSRPGMIVMRRPPGTHMLRQYTLLSSCVSTAVMQAPFAFLIGNFTECTRSAVKGSSHSTISGFCT